MLIQNILVISCSDMRGSPSESEGKKILFRFKLKKEDPRLLMNHLGMIFLDYAKIEHAF